MDETRAEFFRKGGHLRGLVQEKGWLILTRWHHLKREDRQNLNALIAVNRRLPETYQLREVLEQLWTYAYERPAR